METNTNPSHKSRISVVLVALMFVAVSMVAVGFAMKSTLTINDNEVDNNYYVIEYADNTGNTDITDLTLSPSLFKVYTDIVLDDGEKTLDAKIEGGEITQVFYVKVSTNDTSVSDFNLAFTTDIGTKQYLKQFVSVDEDSFEVEDVDGIEGLKKVTLTMTIAGGEGQEKDIKSITGLDFSDFKGKADLEGILDTICSETYSVTVNAEPVTA